MSILIRLLEHWSRRHAKHVEQKYAHRKLRMLDFYKGATLQTQIFDPDRTIFDKDFYDDLKDQKNAAHSYAMSSMGYFILITTAILSIILGAEVALFHSALRLGDIGVLLDFVVILAGYFVYRFISSGCEEVALMSLIEAHIRNTRIGNKSIELYPEVKALWMSKFGHNFLDYSQSKIVVKGKYIFAPYKLRRYISLVLGFAADLAILGSLCLYGYLSVVLIAQPPIHWAVSLISVVIFWIIVAIGVLEFLALFFLETGILAKGRKEKDKATEEDDGDILIEL